MCIMIKEKKFLLLLQVTFLLKQDTPVVRSANIVPSFLQLFCHLLLFILPYLYLDVDSLMKCRIRILGTTPFLYKKPQYPHVHFWIKKFSQQFLIFGKGEKFRTEKGQKCERFAQIKYRNEALIFLINERIIPRGGVCFLKVVSQNN